MKIYNDVAMLPLRKSIMFPGVVCKLEVAREKSRNTVNQNNAWYFIVAQRQVDVEPTCSDDLYQVGVLARSVSVKTNDNYVELTVQVVRPAKLLSAKFDQDTYSADVEAFDYEIGSSVESDALVARALDTLKKFAEMSKMIDKDKLNKFIAANDGDAINLVNRLSNDMVQSVNDRQLILSTIDNNERLEVLIAVFLGNIELAKVEKRIANRVKKQIDAGQKEFYLREQMKAISHELGDGESEAEQYDNRIDNAKMPNDVAEKARKEVRRLTKMAPTSPDASVIRNYVEWLCDLPWDKLTKDNFDLSKARDILNEDHYGLDKIKDRIIEYIAVMQLTGKLNGPILCFVGPPGVGKTSIARSIARSLDRKYIRVSLGGVRDEAEVRGHRRTYVGAIPGKIMTMLKQAGCSNPVILLDEIDKMGKDMRGDPASAMLEVLDPEQNCTFTDHFLEVPYDLSKVLFVCTANAIDDIPAPLLDRMEIIELSGYTEYEKISIAKSFLLPKNLLLHGIEPLNISIDDKAIADIIDRYTRESGVRNLEREIAKICRKIALKIVANHSETVVVSSDNLEDFLGNARFRPDNQQHDNVVGSATGLAWTRVGGTTLNIDATLFSGKGEVLLTGKLGDVMKESARTAISLVRSMCDEYGIDKNIFETTDIHIHVPEGATPKDGPSAGITMATVILSAFSGVSVRGDVAMTGEVTLRGKVLAIGGLKEKILAAYRNGIHTIILPKDNEVDLEEIPQEISSKMTFVLAEDIRTVFSTALVKS